MNKLYVVSEEQIEAIQVLVWGAQMTSPNDPPAFAQLIEKIKTQRLEIFVDGKMAVISTHAGGL